MKISIKILIQHARVPCLFVLAFCGLLTGEPVHAAEPADVFPLWNGRESPIAYAQRVGLEPAKTVDLANGVKLELVLIPAGSFVMGTPDATPPTLSVTVAVVLIVLGLLAAALLLHSVFRRARRVGRLSFSLLWLLLFNVSLACTLGGAIAGYRAYQQQAVFRVERVRASESSDDEHPAKLKVISKPFYMGKYEVTQAQYQAVMGTNPSHFQGPNNPVESLSWLDAAAFCRALKVKADIDAALPSEAQWEYACRAGTTTAFNTGDTLLPSQANTTYWKNSTLSVGSYPPNDFGLYDMHGNVWEWCADYYRPDSYATSPERDPAGPEPATGEKELRIIRGGSWRFDTTNCRSARRSRLDPAITLMGVGFRIVVPCGK